MVMPNSGPPDLTGQVAIVTGATGDIGQVTARALADCGAAVVGTDIHDLSDAFVADDSIAYKQLDVTSKSAAESLVADVMSERGRIDIAVLAAGIATLARVDTVTDEEWD
ncbi:MAG: SDR family NAD(P)-dependent oxidoreductase [Alphaproteobacteria bacterium]|nr:SDR family NAD(P)-dependent oxidoreductase [Alphaproteobacteria bacterium]